MPRSHTPGDTETGLLALALAGGNAAEAQRTLAEMDPPLKISGATLHRWKTMHAQRYAEIHDAHVAELETIVVRRVREAILQAGELQSRVLAKLLVSVDAGELDAKDLANILKSAGVTLGINVEKMLLLTNRPTVIAEKRDVAEMIANLARSVPGLIVDADAVEMEPARALGTPKGAHDGAPESDS